MIYHEHLYHPVISNKTACNNLTEICCYANKTNSAMTNRKFMFFRPIGTGRRWRIPIAMRIDYDWAQISINYSDKQVNWDVFFLCFMSSCASRDVMSPGARNVLAVKTFTSKQYEIFTLFSFCSGAGLIFITVIIRKEIIERKLSEVGVTCP